MPGFRAEEQMTLLRFVILFLPPFWLIAHCPFWKMCWRWRLLLAFALLLISQCHAIDALLFKSLAGPDMPAWLLLPQLWLYTALLLLFGLVLCQDLFWLTRWLWRIWRSRRKPPAFSPERRAFLRHCTSTALSSATAPTLALGLSAYGLSQGIAVPRLHEMTLFSPDLPPGLDGLKIAHLTDIHLGPLTSLDWARQTVARTNAAKPDLICLTGDLTDGRPDFQIAGGGTRQEAIREFARLSAGLGVFACTGNHEYYSDYPGWMRLYAENGIRVLHNAGEVLEHHGAQVALVGMDDRTGKRFGFDVQADRKQLLAGLPGRKEKAFRILMDHRPDTAFTSAAAGADLQLSGHTHGGQCFGMDLLVAHFNHNLVRGWYRVSGMPLYVSNGVGLWPGYPMRLGIPAEIALITLKRGPATGMPEAEEARV